jgi:hypothetical protein
MSALQIVEAPPVYRRIPKGATYPQPESCPPYRDATGLGFVLRPRLPLLFVKTSRGELLPDAATALAYARENASTFADVLAVIGERAGDVLDQKVVASYEAEFPLLFRDLVQPYALFATGHFSIPTGFSVESGPGVGTLIGPPLNRTSPLPLRSGLIETDWHHKPLFLVTSDPEFTGRSLLLLPEADLAQVYFVAYGTPAQVLAEHEVEAASEAADYQRAWDAHITGLAAEGKGVTVRRSGIASVSLGCLHCRLSVTEAAEGRLPHDHVISNKFIPGYQVKQAQMRRKADLRE